MNSFLTIIAKILATPLVAILTFAGYNVNQPQQIIQTQIVKPSPAPSPKIILGDYNPTGGGTYRLQNSIGTTNTSVNLSSFKEPVSGIPYTMTYMNSTLGYGTLDPQQPTKTEFVSFTGITQNSDGSARLTGVTRGLSRSPGTGGCVASTTLATSHSGQAVFVLSNSPCFYSEYAVKRNNESITGAWTTIEPTGSTGLATKNYVDTHVNGGTVSVDTVKVAATAGETVAAGQILYLKQNDARWYKASVAIPEATTTILGIAEGSGTAGVAISSGVLVNGLDANQSGLTAGANYFLGPIAGTISTATSSRIVGRANSATQLYFNTTFQNSGLFTINGATTTVTSNFSFSSSSNTTFKGLSTFTGTTTFVSAATSSVIMGTSTLKVGAFPVWQIGKQSQVFTSSGTFIVPQGISVVCAELVSAGGGGGSSNTSANGQGGGGGGGGYARGCFDVSATTTIGITAGTAGTGGVTSSGFNGGASFVSTFMNCTGGQGGARGTAGGGGASGVCTSSAGVIGYSTVTGQNGQNGSAVAATIQGGGGNSFFGFGSLPPALDSISPGQAFGGGGGGSKTSDTNEENGGAGTGGEVIITW